MQQWKGIKPLLKSSVSTSASNSSLFFRIPSLTITDGGREKKDVAGVAATLTPQRKVCFFCSGGTSKFYEMSVTHNPGFLFLLNMQQCLEIIVMEVHLSNCAVELKWVFRMKISYLEWRVKLPFYKSVEIELGLQENGVEQRQARECKITMGALKCRLNKNNPKKSDPMKSAQKKGEAAHKNADQGADPENAKRGKANGPCSVINQPEDIFHSSSLLSSIRV